jgi:diguanylate cyclase (GGDEF)-like protein
MKPSLSRLPKPWNGLEPYLPLIRALLPRAQCIAVFDAAGQPRFLSESGSGAQFSASIEEALRQSQRKTPVEGFRRHLTDDCSDYLFYLREGKTLSAILAIAMKQPPNVGAASFSSIQSLLRPLLEVLRRDLSAQASIEQLRGSLNARDRDLEILLAGPAEDTSGRGDGADDLKAILDSCRDHLDCVLTTLIVPDKSLALIRTRGGDTRHNWVVARMHRQLLSVANLRREPMIANRVSSNPPVPFRILSCAVRNARGRPIGMLALFRDQEAPQFVERDARLADLLARKIAGIIASMYDAMTGLLNRPALESRLRRAVADSDGTSREWSALFIDVDQLHMINEELGMPMGDAVIERIGELIRRRLPSGSLAARIAGDLFCIAVPATLEDAGQFAESLRAGIEQLGVLQGESRARVSVCIGVAPLAPYEAELSHSIAAAESACKTAKDRGRNRVEIYQTEDSSLVRRYEDMGVAVQVRGAISEDRFRLDGQLILPLGDAPGLRPHYEILLRMIALDGSTVGPDRFMSGAHRYQLMPTIDRWVVKQTLETLKPHATLLAGRPMGFAINCSGQSLSDTEFPDFLIDALEASGLDPALFTFELTETAAVQNLGRAETLMRRLRKLGSRIALDDFGTGLSSLSYLRSLPVDVLKIDGSFVRDILRDPRSESMVAAIAQLARSMSIETVAEYVESEEIRSRLVTLGIDYGQGYAIRRPVPLIELLMELPVIAAGAPALHEHGPIAGAVAGLNY